MLRLKTLGGLSLEDSGRPITGAAAQRSRLALLALLAAHGGRGISREKLLAYLWPESNEAHARNALNQALFTLRRDLHAAALVVGTIEARLNPEVISDDACEFESALARGDFERAVSLYTGPFLDGFYLKGAPEFERWVESERGRLAARYAEALEQLAAYAQAQGDHRKAVQWWRQLTMFDPLDSRYALGLMEALAASGDRPAALKHAQLHAALVKLELDSAPDPAVAALADEWRQAADQHRRPPRGKEGSVPGEGEAIVPPADQPVPERQTQAKRTPRSRLAEIGAAAAATVLILGALRVVTRFAHHPANLDPNRVAVLPFRLTGDPAFAYLREGMVDLLAAKLTGEGGPRAADPLIVMQAWQRAAGPGERDLPQEAALKLAQRLGAGQVLIGDIVGTQNRLILNATLLLAASGKSRGTATVEGPPDSLLSLVDRLTAQVLVRGAGEEDSRLASLTSTSLPALRAYLAGQAANRDGKYEEAVRDYQQALSLDSSFALAGVGLMSAGNWIGDTVAESRGNAVVRAYPTRLGRQFGADRPENWSGKGDYDFHGGSIFGIDMRASLDHAAAEFRRALDLDSAFGQALSHLVQYSVAIRDSAAVRQYGTRYLAVDSAGDLADYVRWLMAKMSQDSAALEALRLKMPHMRVWSLVRIVGESQLEGFGLDDAQRATVLLQGRVGSPGEVTNIYQGLHNLALNRGRPHAALVVTKEWRELDPSVQGHDRRLILDALYWDGDSAAAAQAVHRLSAYADARPIRNAKQRTEQTSDICAVELWRLAHGSFRTVPRAIAQLRHPTASPSSDPAIGGEVCATLLDALLAAHVDRADRVATLEHLDSVLTTAPGWNPGVMYTHFGNLEVARLREMRGDIRGALATVRRRLYEWWMPTFLTTYLREEGRLPALTGDREGAMRAYRHYLALRSDPEPALIPQRDSVRVELEKLLGRAP